tara:strand:+ start:128 stop:2152 length:2025 start_codon:yes stop_codon:yes gene_type:complete
MVDILKRVEELSDLFDNKGSEKLEFNSGGRIGYALGSTDNSIIPQNNLTNMTLEESTTGPGGFPMTAGVTPLTTDIITKGGPRLFKAVKDIYQKTFSPGGSGQRKEIEKVRDKKFAETVKNILDTDYKGNMSALARDLGIGTRTPIFTDFIKHGIDTTSKGSKNIEKFNIGGEKLSLSKITDLAKKDDTYLINRTKSILGNNFNKFKNEYVSIKDLANAMGVNITKADGTINRSTLNDLNIRLKNVNKKFGLDTEKAPDGVTNYYKLEDTLQKFQKHNLSKRIPGETTTGKLGQVTKRRDFLKNQDKEGFLVRDNLNSELRRTIGKILGDDKVKFAVEDIGHAESVANQMQYKKLYKGSNVEHITSLVFQDPILNKDVLMRGTESARKKYLNILENLVGKKSNPQNIKIANEALLGLNKLNDQARLRIIERSKEIPLLTGQEKRIIDFTLTLPKKGETFKSGMLNIDKSKIDPSISVGRILEINPNAKTYNDLNKKQKQLYKENYKNQMADYLKYFYSQIKLNKKPGSKMFDKDEIEEIYEGIQDMGITKKYNLGGPVNIDLTMPTRIIKKDGGRIAYKSGSYLFDAAKSLGKRYKGSTLQSLLENPKILGTELGYEGLAEILRLIGMKDGGLIIKKAGGGIAKLAGIDMGPQVESMNPDSQGLQGLMKRGIKT